VPALIDDGVVVHDSTIINEYLEDKFPQNPLLPRDPVMRARATKLHFSCDPFPISGDRVLSGCPRSYHGCGFTSSYSSSE
jgi:hypothetical protein